MNPLVKLILALFVLGILTLLFPVLFVMAFYAESGSYTINFIGRLLFIPYSVIAILALTSFFKNISRIFKNL